MVLADLKVWRSSSDTLIIYWVNLSVKIRGSSLSKLLFLSRTCIPSIVSRKLSILLSSWVLPSIRAVGLNIIASLAKTPRIIWVNILLIGIVPIVVLLAMYRLGIGK